MVLFFGGRKRLRAPFQAVFRRFPFCLTALVFLGTCANSSADLILFNPNHTLTSASIFDIDLNNDSTVDFQIGFVPAGGGNPEQAVISGPSTSAVRTGALLDEGQLVSDSDSFFEFSGSPYPLYAGNSGLLPSAGANGFLGLRITVDTGGAAEDLLGFVELTRGSLTIGTYGFENVAGSPAVTTRLNSSVAVPEPCQWTVCLSLFAAGVVRRGKLRLLLKT